MALRPQVSGTHRNTLQCVDDGVRYYCPSLPEASCLLGESKRLIVELAEVETDRTASLSQVTR